MTDVPMRDIDHEIWQKELDDFVPARFIDAHVHLGNTQFDMATTAEGRARSRDREERGFGKVTMEFWQEDFYWIALKGAANTQREEISSHELEHCDLMLLKEGHCLKDHALAVCHLSEISSHRLSATSLNTLVQLVANGLGRL